MLKTWRPGCYLVYQSQGNSGSETPHEEIRIADCHGYPHVWRLIFDYLPLKTCEFISIHHDARKHACMEFLSIRTCIRLMLQGLASRTCCWRERNPHVDSGVGNAEGGNRRSVLNHMCLHLAWWNEESPDNWLLDRR